MKIFKKIILGVLLFLAVLLLGAGGFVGYLSITEYKPQPIEDLTFGSNLALTLKKEDQISFLSWNIGYGALGAESDFFMDGGKTVRPAQKSIGDKNLAGIVDFLKNNPVDVYLFQEVDEHSKRSYFVDQVKGLEQELDMPLALAYNFHSPYVPFPFPPIGEVKSGIVSGSNFVTLSSQRYDLPTSFTWPVRIANLKRALLVQRIPIENTTQELVVVNVHLEAYDSGEGKIAQTKVLVDLMLQEYNKNNYVVVGGDFNQTFPMENPEKYVPLKPEYWKPGTLDPSILPEGWQFLADETTPTSRLLDRPLADQAGNNKIDPATPMQTYLIDGFIISPNLICQKVETIDAGFAYSDHNPVQLQISFGE